MTVDIDPAALRQLEGLAGEDGADLAGELIDLFASHTPVKIAELHEAIAQGDASAAYRHAHTVAGSALSLGATGLVALARQAETLARQDRLGEIAPVADRMTAALGPTIARLREIRAAR